MFSSIIINPPSYNPIPTNNQLQLIRAPLPENPDQMISPTFNGMQWIIIWAYRSGLHAHLIRTRQILRSSCITTSLSDVSPPQQTLQSRSNIITEWSPGIFAKGHRHGQGPHTMLIMRSAAMRMSTYPAQTLSIFMQSSKADIAATP